eukprot:gene15098-31094_t
MLYMYGIALLAAASPPDTSWYGNTRHGEGFVNVKDFGAMGDGVADDTQAIQEAIDSNRLQERLPPPPTQRPFAPPRRAVVYLPPGTYAVSDTISLWFFTHLRASALKPILATAGGCNQSLPWWLDSFHANDMFYNQIHSVDIKVDTAGHGNAGAVGLYWSIAQQTSIRDVTIHDAAVGIDVAVTRGYATPLHSSAGLGGGGTIEDVTIVGGDVGMRCEGSQYTMRGLTFHNQKTAALQVAGDVWTFAFASIEASNTPTFLEGISLVLENVTLNSYDSYDSHGAADDVARLPHSIVSAGSESWVGVDNNGCVPLDTITTTTTTTTFTSGGRDGNDGGGGWKTKKKAASCYIDRWAGFGGQGPHHNTPNGVWIHNELQKAPRQRLPGAREQALPNRARPCAVFLPSGIYKCTDTLKLNASTVLVGEALTQLYLVQSATGFSDPAQPKIFVDTPDDPHGEVLITDVSIQAGWGNDGAVMMRWRVGPASGMWDVHINISHNVHVGLHVTGSGAGVISNMWGWGADHAQWTGEHKSQDAADIGFLGDSQGPLWCFGVAFEHHRNQMFALEGASNYIFLALQTEQAWWLPPTQANNTVHMAIGAGTSNVTVYGELHCSWAPRSQTTIAKMVSIDRDVQDGVSIFGLRDIGAAAAINQPGIEEMPRPHDYSWLDVVADVGIKGGA